MMIFKILLVIAVTYSFVYAYESKKSTKEIFDHWRRLSEKDHPECIKAWNVSEEDLDRYFRLYEFPDKRNFKCFMDCLYKGFNLINKDGTINRDELVKGFEKVSNEMIEYCNARIVTKTDDCERIHEFADCLVHYGHVYF
ncbi:hypothetical protein RI129_011036 [Pyrocoelia pectoralis]|uniref:Uncharacterized protein n=1 Tax=Pyrocoelia pectoralis TaxID=417401 RepID=A0AAN7V083_9COLE